jgi:hypothetical protein
MYVDIWIFGVFALLFGACAWWNRTQGISFGIEATLDKLEQDKIIRIIGDKIVPFNRMPRRRRNNT